MRTWILQQVENETELHLVEQQMRTAWVTSKAYGISVRVPWSSIQDNLKLLDSIRAEFYGMPLSIRFMAGRYTPEECRGRAFVYDGSATNGLGAGSIIPAAFGPNGGKNLVFENRWITKVKRVARWCRHNDVDLLHLPWFGLLWAELALISQMYTLPGYTYEQVVASHRRLLFAARDIVTTGDFEFPISGHALPALRQAITTTIYDNPDIAARCVLQSNNLDDSGLGVPRDPDGLRRAFQMVGNGSFDWGRVFAICSDAEVEYLEVYTRSFTQPGNEELRAEIERSA